MTILELYVSSSRTKGVSAGKHHHLLLPRRHEVVPSLPPDLDGDVRGRDGRVTANEEGDQSQKRHRQHLVGFQRHIYRMTGTDSYG